MKQLDLDQQLFSFLTYILLTHNPFLFLCKINDVSNTWKTCLKVTDF